MRVEPLLRLAGVTKRFGDKVVLEAIDLEVRAGEFLTLLGPSGCGKTTLLRLVAGFDTPSAGVIEHSGRSLAGLPPERRPFNTVFQSYALFPHMDVWDNVAFALRMTGIAREVQRERVEAVLARVRMSEYAQRRPAQLSGGQQQRVALARALVGHPEVLLLDEPLSALDLKLRRQMQRELATLQRELGTTFILVTHDQEEALAMSDRVVVMSEGRIQQVDTPRGVYERPANAFVADFVGEANILEARVVEQLPDKRWQLRIAGREVAITSRKTLTAGQLASLVLRPEDMRVYSRGEAIPDEISTIPGTVVTRTYKGTTLDSVIRLEDGTEVLASEFFDEEWPEFDHPLGEPVQVGWVPNWEWVL